MAKPRNDTQCRKGKLCVGKWLCSCASTEQVKLRSKYCPKYLNIPHCPICGDFSQYFRLFEIRGIVRRGGSERGWDHIWLDQASHPRVSDEYANTNTHPFLCLVAGWLDLILIFRLPHNIYVADSLLVSDQFLTRTENCFGKARNFLWKKHQKANIGSFY